MFALQGVALYLVIFLAKLVEVSLSTIRNVLINRGQKFIGACIGFFEVLIWLYVVSNVLQNVTDDLVKVGVYCLAFSCGNYLGATIEEKLAIGMAVIDVFILKDESYNLVDILRKDGFGVTTIDSQGKDNKMVIIKIYLKRKNINKAILIINKNAPKSIVSVSDVKNLKGAFIRK